MQTPKLPPVNILRENVHSKLSKGFSIEIEKKEAHIKQWTSLAYNKQRQKTHIFGINSNWIINQEFLDIDTKIS